MIICVTPEDMARDRAPKFDGRLVELFGDRNLPWDGPSGHLVNQRAADANPPHFHEADQYQLFIAGEGRVGGHAVAPGSVHYADGFSGYGPIVAAPEGCSYLTLRAAHDTSSHKLPEEAALAQGRKGRQHMGAFDLSDGRQPGVETLFERADGVATYQVDAAPGAAVSQPPVVGASYWVVMKGEALVDGHPCPARTCLWVGQGEARPAMTAGPEGVTLAVLCFAPRDSQAARGARTWLEAAPA